MEILSMCDVIRSKNSGPFELTFDLIFKNKELYDQAQGSGKITKKSFAKLYQIKEDDVLSLIWFLPAHALKITINRPVGSGDLKDKDIYGAGQHTQLFQWVL